MDTRKTSDFDDDDLTPEEAELLEIYRAMGEADQSALALVATYLANRPPGEEITMEKMDELFEQAKRVQ